MYSFWKCEQTIGMEYQLFEPHASESESESWSKVSMMGLQSQN